jgi:molybdenum storage protein
MRKNIKSKFTNESLIDKKLLRKTDIKPVRIFPDLTIIKIGGQSCFDYGKKVIYPLVEEIAKAREKYQMLITTGGGTRARHVYDIGLDLGMPVGILATLGRRVASQNAIMLNALLAKHGGVRITSEDIDSLSQYLDNNYIPILPGMPTFGHWEPPPEVGNIPSYRTDAGTYLLAEVLGAKRIIFVKDEDGLYTNDPKKHKNVKLIKKISVKKLLENNLPDHAIETTVLNMMKHAKFAKKLQIINGHKKGNLTKALEGKEIGTVIYV